MRSPNIVRIYGRPRYARSLDGRSKGRIQRFVGRLIERSTVVRANEILENKVVAVHRQSVLRFAITAQVFKKPVTVWLTEIGSRHGAAVEALLPLIQGYFAAIPQQVRV